MEWEKNGSYFGSINYARLDAHTKRVEKIKNKIKQQNRIPKNSGTTNGFGVLLFVYV